MLGRQDRPISRLHALVRGGKGVYPERGTRIWRDEAGPTDAGFAVA